MYREHIDVKRQIIIELTEEEIKEACRDYYCRREENGWAKRFEVQLLRITSEGETTFKAMLTSEEDI